MPGGKEASSRCRPQDSKDSLSSEIELHLQSFGRRYSEHATQADRADDTLSDRITIGSDDVINTKLRE